MRAVVYTGESAEVRTDVQLGQPSAGITVAAPITHLLQVDRGVLGSRAGGVRAQHDIPMLVGLYQRDLFKLDELITRTYPVERFFDLVADMKTGALARGVLTFD